MESKIKNIKKFITEHKLATFLITIVAYCAFTVSLYGFSDAYYSKWFKEPIIPLNIEFFYYACQSATAVFIVAGVIFAALQYYDSCKDSDNQWTIETTQKAIDLSNYYKDNILSKYHPIRYIYRESGIMECLDKIDVERMVDFDYNEATKICQDSMIKEMNNIFNSEDFVKALLDGDKIYNFNLRKDFDFGYEVEPKCLGKKDTQQLAVTFINEYVSEILNNLEYFALHFTKHTASEEAVYQSLHRSYLEIVETLYYIISKFNMDPASKLYTNVIELYRKWKKYERDIVEEKRKHDNSLIRHGGECKR